MPTIKQAVKTGDHTFEMTDVVLDIENAPDDCDWSRWGMLDDRKSTRMYCFKSGTKNHLYQFLFDGKSYKFEEGYDLTIEGITSGHNTDKIGMLSTPNFDEAVGVMDKEAGKPLLPIPNNYHVYMQKAGDTKTLLQFLWERKTSHLKSNGLTREWFGVNDFPTDTDWKRWTLTYDSNHYQLSLPAYVFYAFKEGSQNEIYFGRYGATGNQKYKTDAGETKTYAVYSYKESAHPVDKAGDQYYGQAKCGNIKIEGLAEAIKVTDFSVVFDGINTYMYLLTNQD